MINTSSTVLMAAALRGVHSHQAQLAMRCCLAVLLLLLLTTISSVEANKRADKDKQKASKKQHNLEYNKFCNETTNTCFAYAEFFPPATGSPCFWTRLEVRTKR
jgi:hypothetical protein